MTVRLTLLCAATLLVACGDDGTAQKGSEGGECRIALEPCDDGLVCSRGECRQPTSASETKRLLLDVPIIEDELDADGKAATPIRFKVRDADAGEPYEGDIWMWVEPPGAGVLKDRMIELDSEGQGLTSFVACNGKYRDCPAFATIRFAADESPEEWIGSRTIRLIGGNDYNTRAPEGEPGDDTTTTGGGGDLPGGGADSETRGSLGGCPLDSNGLVTFETADGEVSAPFKAPTSATGGGSVNGRAASTSSVEASAEGVGFVRVIFASSYSVEGGGQEATEAQVTPPERYPVGIYTEDGPVAIQFGFAEAPEGCPAEFGVNGAEPVEGDSLRVTVGARLRGAELERQVIIFSASGTRECGGNSLPFSFSGCMHLDYSADL